MIREINMNIRISRVHSHRFLPHNEHDEIESQCWNELEEYDAHQMPPKVYCGRTTWLQDVALKWKFLRRLDIIVDMLVPCFWIDVWKSFVKIFKIPIGNLYCKNDSLAVEILQIKSSLSFELAFFQAIAIMQLAQMSTGMSWALESGSQYKDLKIPFPIPSMTPVAPWMPSMKPSHGSALAQVMMAGRGIAIGNFVLYSFSKSSPRDFARLYEFGNFFISLKFKF